MLPQYTIQKCLERLQTLGFDGVEICLEHPDITPDKLTASFARQLADQVRELDLAPHSVSYHKDYVYDETLFEETCKAIALTREFGTNIFVFSGPAKRTDETEEWRLTLERTRELVRIAEQHDVILAEEFEPGFVIGSTADLLRLFEEIPSSHLKANVDLGHAFLCDPEPLKAISDLRGTVVHAHVENMHIGIHRHLPPQEGDMDLNAYLAALHSIGFNGGVALDLYEQDYEVVAPDAIAFLKQCISKISEGSKSR